MHERQIELTVGQSVRVGDMLVTILEIENDEIHVRIDEGWGGEETDLNDQRDMVLALPR